MTFFYNSIGVVSLRSVICQRWGEVSKPGEVILQEEVFEVEGSKAAHIIQWDGCNAGIIPWDNVPKVY